MSIAAMTPADADVLIAHLQIVSETLAVRDLTVVEGVRRAFVCGEIVCRCGVSENVCLRFVSKASSYLKILLLLTRNCSTDMMKMTSEAPLKIRNARNI